MSLVTARAEFLPCMTQTCSISAVRGGADLTCANTHTPARTSCLQHVHTRPTSLRCGVIHEHVCESVSSVRHNRWPCVCVGVSCLFTAMVLSTLARWHVWTGVLTIACVSTWFSTASTSLNVCHVGIYHIFTLSLTVCLLPIMKNHFNRLFVSYILVLSECLSPIRGQNQPSRLSSLWRFRVTVGHIHREGHGCTAGNQQTPKPHISLIKPACCSAFPNGQHTRKNKTSKKLTQKQH